ncbi:MAG TPA: transporter [Bryobacteraceae bacterium]|jgi:hypothetical protein
MKLVIDTSIKTSRRLHIHVGAGRTVSILKFALMAIIWVAAAKAQQLGHKVLGSAGLFAGSQPDSGLYVIDQFAAYSSDEVFDRTGHRIPVGLDLDAWTSPVGFQMTFKLPWRSMYMNFSAAAPIAQVSLQISQPEASVDDFGFGDVYVQPIKVGWKMTRMDIVTGYSFYAPTGLYTPRASGGIGQGQWTHEFSAGGLAYFDRAKTWSISALTSYDLNQHKEGIDITRGDTFQFQGGAGKTFRRPGKTLQSLSIGVAGYGLWQVRDDRGADLPAALRGARDLALGLGPELDSAIAPIRGQITVRYCRDVAVKARPLGRLLVIQLTILARR